MEEKNTQATPESKLYIEEQFELNEMAAASWGTVGCVSSSACPGSTVATVSTQSSMA